MFAKIISMQLLKERIGLEVPNIDKEEKQALVAETTASTSHSKSVHD